MFIQAIARKPQYDHNISQRVLCATTCGGDVYQLLEATFGDDVRFSEVWSWARSSYIKLHQTSVWKTFGHLSLHFFTACCICYLHVSDPSKLGTRRPQDSLRLMHNAELCSLTEYWRRDLTDSNVMLVLVVDFVSLHHLQAQTFESQVMADCLMKMIR